MQLNKIQRSCLRKGKRSSALQLAGQGNFYDQRLMNKDQYPVAAKAGFGNKRSDTDYVSSKLAALLFYQLAIPAPKAPEGSYNKEAAGQGQLLFNGKAKCASCHIPPLFAEPGWSTHKPEEICIDDFQSNRSPDKTYVTQGLKGLWAHAKGGFYHNGRFAILLDVINHYNSCKNLNLSESEKNDLVEYLKSL
jgi:cytochrome c peroxidase